MCNIYLISYCRLHRYSLSSTIELYISLQLLIDGNDEADEDDDDDFNDDGDGDGNGGDNGDGDDNDDGDGNDDADHWQWHCLHLELQIKSSHDRIIFSPRIMIFGKVVDL